MTSFVHQPLHDPSNEIRLLTLQASDGTDSIRCTLSHISGSVASSSYVCLSYVWGTDLPAHEIRVNDEPYHVRSNLFAFLLTARRYNHTSQPFWIDAICINQDDLVEKGFQVRRMGQIYQQAGSTIIWLGLSDRSCNLMLKRQSLEDKKKSIEAFQMNRTESDRSTPPSGFVDACHDISMICCVVCVEALKYLIHILMAHFWFNIRIKRLCRGDYGLSHVAHSIRHNEYWRRAWIVQEIILSSDCWVMCPEGGRVKFQTILDLCVQDQDGGGYRIADASFIGTINETQRQLAYSGLRFAEVEILKSSAQRKCQHARDRFYSVLSLLPGYDDYSIDYRRDLKQEIFRMFLHELGCLRFSGPGRVPHALPFIEVALKAFDICDSNGRCSQSNLNIWSQILPKGGLDDLGDTVHVCSSSLFESGHDRWRTYIYFPVRTITTHALLEVCCFQEKNQKTVYRLIMWIRDDNLRQLWSAYVYFRASWYDKAGCISVGKDGLYTKSWLGQTSLDPAEELLYRFCEESDLPADASRSDLPMQLLEECSLQVRATTVANSYDSGA